VIPVKRPASPSVPDPRTAAVPPPGDADAASQVAASEPSDGDAFVAGTESVQKAGFQPASGLRYECSIHTFTMTDESTGKRYHIMLDLIRSDANPQWGVPEDRSALRAKVWDAETGELVAHQLVNKPRGEFGMKVGKMHLLDAEQRIAFEPPGGEVKNPNDLRFDFDIDVEKSSPVQLGSQLMEGFIAQHAAGLTGEAREQFLKGFPPELLGVDYPVAHHTGSMDLVTKDGEPLHLTADATPSSFSYHYGNAVLPCVFVTTFPNEKGERFLGVIADVGLDLDPSKVGPEVRVPFGYFIRTDAQGRSTPGLGGAGARSLPDGEPAAGRGPRGDDRSGRADRVVPADRARHADWHREGPVLTEPAGPSAEPHRGGAGPGRRGGQLHRPDRDPPPLDGYRLRYWAEA
jgi:hypothetical protein